MIVKKSVHRYNKKVFVRFSYTNKIKLFYNLMKKKKLNMCHSVHTTISYSKSLFRKLLVVKILFVKFAKYKIIIIDENHFYFLIK